MKNKTNILFIYIIFYFVSIVQAQTTNTNNVRPATTAFNGWDGTGSNPGSLMIKNDFTSCATCNIDFYTNATKFLQVLTTGNVNIVIGSNGYMIDNNYVLWNKGNTSDIFVGVNAGNISGTMTGHSNTFVGNNTGSVITSGSNSTIIGTNAAPAITSGNDNTAIGFEALNKDQYLKNNTAVGSGALHESHRITCTGCDTIAGDNTAVGYHSLYNTSAYGGCALGYNSASLNTLGCSLVAIGENALYGNTIADDNNAVGENALTQNKTLSDNVAIGTDALANQSFAEAHSIATRGDNVAVGNYALSNNVPTDTSNGIRNTAIGDSAAYGNATGNNNSFLGYRSTVASSNLNNSTAIGANAVIKASNQMILGGNTGGGTGHNDVNVGIGLSNDAASNGPQSKLEINSYPSSTSYTSTAGTGSGLQFRQLRAYTSTSYPGNYVAPYGKVLTVDSSGIVKLTDGGGLSLNQCGGSVPTLSADLGMDLNHKTIYYDGNNFSSGVFDAVPNSIGLGYACISKLRGKLSVLQSATNTNAEAAAGYFQNKDVSVGGNSVFMKRGIWAVCDGESDNPWNIAGDFFADSSSVINFGVRGIAGNLTQDIAEYINTGGHFESSYGYQNIGVEAISLGGPIYNSINYGIYASAPIGNCQFGPPGISTCSDAAGYFDGDVYTAGGSYNVSDINLKENIQPIKDPLAVVNALEPKTFTFKTSVHPNLNLPVGTQGGLIAQEVEKVLPNLIKSFAVPAHTDRSGNVDSTGAGSAFKAVNYIGLIPYLIGAIKQQQANIDSLKNLVDTLNMKDSLMSARMDQLEQLINTCCSKGSTHRVTNPALSITLSNGIILNQNDPNPFAQETKITFNIPSNVSEAKIIFFDNLGHIIQTVNVNDRGYGQINVYASDLASGIYSYSLIADGKVIDTKKMVCTK